MNEAIQELLGTIQTMAPHVWEVYIRQVWIQGIQQAIVLVILIAVAVWASKIAYKNWEDEWDTDHKFIFGLLMVILFCFIIPLSMSVTGRLLNPEFYAIQGLLSNVQ